MATPLTLSALAIVTEPLVKVFVTPVRIVVPSPIVRVPPVIVVEFAPPLPRGGSVVVQEALVGRFSIRDVPPVFGKGTSFVYTEVPGLGKPTVQATWRVKGAVAQVAFEGLTVLVSCSLPTVNAFPKAAALSLGAPLTRVNDGVASPVPVVVVWPVRVRAYVTVGDIPGWVSVTAQDAPEGNLSKLFEPHAPSPSPVMPNEVLSTVEILVELSKVHVAVKVTDFG